MARGNRRSPPTVASVKSGLASLLRLTETVRTEVNGLREQMGGFAKGRELRPHIFIVRDNFNQSSDTQEPSNAIDDIVWEYESQSNLEAPTRALIAIAKELNSALTDVRATRTEIQAVVNDADLRADFKVWLENHR